MSNTTNTKRGFTLVELLIVIVVIAILAAISIVAYNGVQNRSKNTAAQALATQVANKAQAYNTVQSYYPANEDAFAAVPESQLEGIDLVTGAPADETEVQYVACPNGATGSSVTGANITWRTFPSGVDTRQVGTC